MVKSLLNSKYFLVVVFWVFLTAFNITKAFHIDDTFHLKAAQHIQKHPTTPMSGLINWSDNPEPMYYSNQPPLFFYLIALVSSLFGFNEIPLHLLLSVFTFIALFYFRKSTEILSLKNKNTLLTLFAFYPALVINQNVMVDVPILAISIAAFYYVIKARHTDKIRYYILASIILGTGLLIKYSLLPLLVVLVVETLVSGKYKQFLALLIVVGMMAIWAFWNYAEFGFSHLFGRSAGIIHIKMLWKFMAAMGATGTFLISFVYGTFPYKGIKRVIYLFLGVFVLSVLAFYFDRIPEKLYADTINMVFIFIGGGFFIIMFYLLYYYLSSGFMEFVKSDMFVVFLFISSMGLFIILFAPFIATRHIMLIVPFVLWFGSHLIDKAGSVNKLSIVVSIVFTILFGVSDWTYADYYRKAASDKIYPLKGMVWTAGHWGWQWYAEQNDMQEYSTNDTTVKVGDYMIYPVDISRSDFNPKLKMKVIEKRWEEPSTLTFISGSNFASFYNSSLNVPPWTLSKIPIDTIYVCRVTETGTNHPNH